MRWPWLLFALFVVQGAVAQQPDRRPNLLFVLTDDQRFDQMGCAGHPVLQTPNIDKLAAGGVRFTNAFVTTAICAASRASILTGCREGRHGYTFGKPAMGKALADQSYPMLLKQAGYRTGFVGKWGVKFDQGTMDAAFDWRHDLWYPYRKPGERHLTDRIGDLASEFLMAKDGRPFCLSISFHAPHAQDGSKEQYLPPEDLAELYADAEVAPPPHAEHGYSALPPFLKDSMGRDRWALRFDTPQKQQLRTRDYWRLISGVDRVLGRLLDLLETTGRADDTVIVFTSDNGYFLGERGLAGKWYIYEESIRVPLIVYDPRAEAGRRGITVDAMVLNTDLPVTMLELAGVALPASATYDGRSIVPLLRGEAVDDWRQDFLYEHLMDNKKIPMSVGVRGQRYVYARFFQQQPVYEQLFDLQTDPAQLHDLARDDAQAELLGRMRARCDELLAK